MKGKKYVRLKLEIIWLENSGETDICYNIFIYSRVNTVCKTRFHISYASHHKSVLKILIYTAYEKPDKYWYTIFLKWIPYNILEESGQVFQIIQNIYK